MTWRQLFYQLDVACEYPAAIDLDQEIKVDINGTLYNVDNLEGRWTFGGIADPKLVITENVY